MIIRVRLRTGWGAKSKAHFTKADERAPEPKIKIGTSVVVTPLASLATRLQGSVVNVSIRGVKVHFDARLSEQPRPGEIYRVQSRGDLFLCEVCNFEAAAAGADLDLQIIN